MARVWPLRRRTMALLAFVMTISGLNVIHYLRKQQEESRLQDVRQQQQQQVMVGATADVADHESASAHNMACLRQGQGGTLVFLHMRKAAGSSLWKLLRSIVDEGLGGGLQGVVVHRAEGRTFNMDCFDSGAVFLTALRDPITRIMSSYHYEGRHFRYDHRMFFESQEQKAEVEATWNEASKLGTFREPESLRDWVADVKQDYRVQSKGYRTSSVWIDVENYYIKTLTNRYRAHPEGGREGGKEEEEPVTREDLALAKQILGRMDVVLITEWLKEPDQLAYFNGVLHLQDLTFPVKHLTDRVEARDEAQAQDEALMLEQLREMNQLDLELYDWAKDLYPSGHGSLAATLAVVLKSLNGGKDEFAAPLSLTAAGADGPITRQYTSLTQALDETSISRVYAGNHFRHSADASVVQDTKAGEAVMAEFDKKYPIPGAAAQVQAKPKRGEKALRRA